MLLYDRMRAINNVHVFVVMKWKIKSPEHQAPGPHGRCDFQWAGSEPMCELQVMCVSVHSHTCSVTSLVTYSQNTKVAKFYQRGTNYCVITDGEVHVQTITQETR